MFLFGSYCECLFLIRSYYYIYTVCHCFEWVWYLWSQKRGSSCASFLNLWSHFDMLQNYNAFLRLIEDISVKKYNNYSDLVVKHTVKLAKSISKEPPCEGHPPLPSTYIYTNTQKWYFKGWHNVAYTKKHAWHTLFFEYNCGAGAGQLNF